MTARRHRSSSNWSQSDVGSSVRIRPIEASDAPLVLDAFTRLSDRSRRLRFLMGKQRLTDAELRYFTEVDHHDHEAVVAVSQFDGRIVGGARFVRLAQDPDSADIAVTVVDDWQGRGLGGQLIARLIERAREEGVVRFVALVADDNVVVAGMLQKFGADVRVVERAHRDTQYQIALDGSGAVATRTWLAVRKYATYSSAERTRKVYTRSAVRRVGLQSSLVRTDAEGVRGSGPCRSAQADRRPHPTGP